jgi:nitrogen regulatory protein P-II 1
MKEIKAFVHRNRVADVLHELKGAGFNRLTLVDVKAMLDSIDDEREYSVELGERVVTEVKLELVCEDARLDEAVTILQRAARTDQPISGWIFVSPIEFHFVIRGGEEDSLP